MTGREKILAAFTADGTPETGVVASYEGIFIRDHYAALTEVPWWDAAKATCLAVDYFKRSGLEWFTVNACPSRAERSRQRYEHRADGVWLVDTETGKETRLLEPTVSGTNTACAGDKHTDPDSLPATPSAINDLIPSAPEFDRNTFLAEGRHDAAVAIRETLNHLMLYSKIASPLLSLYSLLGYEGMMLFLIQNPELALYAGQRILKNVTQRIRMIAALGADAVWIEEALTDQINPGLFDEINVPLLRQCVQEIRSCGLKSIYYYCGNPFNRLDAILDIGADAIHFEESKKGFTVDIADIITKVNGRCVVFGNLDSINVLQNGSEDRLRSEIRRQLESGKRNGKRFVMSTGSPITPETPVEKVRLYTDIVRELSRQ